MILSLEPRRSASSQRAAHATPLSGFCCNALPTNCTTSSFVKFASKTPSQATTMKSPGLADWRVMDGAEITFCCNGDSQQVLKYLSPNARDTASIPSTRPDSIWPPHACMRAASSGTVGLWSVVATHSRVPEPTSTRASPTLPTVRSYWSLPECTKTKAAVHPLSSPVSATKSLSTERQRYSKYEGWSCAPSHRRNLSVSACATNFAQQLPLCPSKTPNTPTPVPVCTPCASSIDERSPRQLATPQSNSDVLCCSTSFCSATVLEAVLPRPAM